MYMDSTYRLSSHVDGIVLDLIHAVTVLSKRIWHMYFAYSTDIKMVQVTLPILKMEDHYIIWIVSVSLNSHLTNIEQKLRQSIQLSNHWNVGVLTLALYEATPPPKLKWLQSET